MFLDYIQMQFTRDTWNDWMGSYYKKNLMLNGTEIASIMAFSDYFSVLGGLCSGISFSNFNRIFQRLYR